MSLPTGTSSVTSASGIPRRRRRSPSLSVPSGKIGSFPPKPSSGAENEGRCGIAWFHFTRRPPFHNRDQEFESVFLQQRVTCELDFGRDALCTGRVLSCCSRRRSVGSASHHRAARRGNSVIPDWRDQVLGWLIPFRVKPG